MNKKLVFIGTLVLCCVMTLVISNHTVVVKAQTSNPTFESEVSVAGGAGHGTTGIYARTFSSVILNTGSDITYTSDSVNGDYFTINTSGIYGVSYGDGASSDNAGITVNFPATTTFSSSWGTGNELCGFTDAGNAESCTVITLLAAGDVLRAHTVNGTANIGQTITRFIVTKIR